MKRWNKKAVPLLAGKKDGTNQVMVWCPYCKKHHIHGWDHSKPDSRAESRCAHCGSSRSPFSSYYITVEPEGPFEGYAYQEE